MLLKDFIAESVAALSGMYGAEEARSVVSILCEEYLGTKSYTHIINPDFAVDKDKQPLLDAAMSRLLKGEPVQYVIGYADFFGYRFKVGPSVLIPRPETEQLCRIASDSIDRRRRMRSAFGKPDVKVLDLCTGSGCIAWSMALSVPGARVLAVDISQDALDVASSQDFKAELKKNEAVRPEFLCADVLAVTRGESIPDAVSQWGGFDILISNPPYVRESERALMRKNVCDFEPPLALFVPDSNPLEFYEAIALWAEAVLADGGAGFVEINEAFGPQTKGLFSGHGFANVELMNDFCGKNRFVRFMK